MNLLRQSLFIRFLLKKLSFIQDRDYPTTVTAASSSSSGFGSEAPDVQDELTPLEQEFEILTQIANAAKKLASDPNAKGRIKSKRWNSYKKAIDKLQVNQGMIDFHSLLLLPLRNFEFCLQFALNRFVSEFSS